MERPDRTQVMPSLWVMLIAALVVLGLLSLPSMGWLLIGVAICLALFRGARTREGHVPPAAAGLMGLIGALIVIAPVLCDTIQTIGISATLEAPITSCRSLAFVPLSDHNWLPFLVLGPAFAIGAALLARRSAHRAG